MAKRPVSRSYAGSLLASFLLIFAGGGMTVFLMAVGADDPMAIPIAVLVFASILLIPINAMRQPRASAVHKAYRQTWGQWLREVFSREKEREVQIKAWKRKKIDHVPEPHGNEYLTFVREDRE